MKFDGVDAANLDLLLGLTSGSAGETSAVLILIGGAYLVARKFMNWRIPISIFATVALITWGFNAYDPQLFPRPAFMLFAGGLMLGAFFMATDPVTSPITPRGAWIFGIGAGVLLVVIRLFGSLPEGVMYSILLMNAVTPLINRYTRPKFFGEQ